MAKHLKEFTLDEIEMIAECDCKTELEHLLNENKIVFEQGVYKYIEKPEEKTSELFLKPTLKSWRNILFQEVAADYINNRRLTKDTLNSYKFLLKYNILPYFGQIKINKITYEMLLDFMQKMQAKYKLKTASNAVTLLGSILKYAFEQGCIKHNPYYGVVNSKCK